MKRNAQKRAGFTLIEVMVALIVAGLFLAVLGRAFATAWVATGRPLDIVSAVSVARFVLAPGTPPDPPAAGQYSGFAFERHASGVAVETRPSDVGPAPPSAAATTAQAPAAPTAPAPHFELRRLSVVVTTPSRRRLSFDTFRLDIAKP